MAEVRVSSEEIVRRYNAAVSPAIRKHTGICFERGEGVYLFDFEGRRYLDFAAGIATNALGHSNPEVLRAIWDQAQRLIHAGIHVGYYLPYVEMAEAVRRIAPGALREGKVLLVNSGSEAVEAALKLARTVTGRSIVIACLGSFHGRTHGALSVTSSHAIFRRGVSGLLNGVFYVPYPIPFGSLWARLSPDERVDACLEYMEYAVTTAVPAEDLAAVIVEPVLGEGGYFIPPPSFLRRLHDFCVRFGALLVIDEVQTGFGRTGRWFAVEHWGVDPAIICFGKAAGGGLPLGGIIAKSELMDRWPTGGHGTTFGGNPLACVGGLATIRIIERDGLLSRALEVGMHILELLNERARSLPMIGDIRGLGLMVGLDVRSPGDRSPTELTRTIIDAAARRGLLVIPCGKSSLRLSPPLVLTKEQAEEGVAILLDAIREVSTQS